MDAKYTHRSVDENGLVERVEEEDAADCVLADAATRVAAGEGLLGDADGVFEFVLGCDGAVADELLFMARLIAAIAAVVAGAERDEGVDVPLKSVNALEDEADAAHLWSLGKRCCGQNCCLHFYGRNAYEMRRKGRSRSDSRHTVWGRTRPSYKSASYTAVLMTWPTFQLEQHNPSRNASPCAHSDPRPDG